MTTKRAVPAGSVPSSTGTGAGSASNATAIPIPPPSPGTGSTVTPVGVAGKRGLRLRLQEMLTGFQTAIPAGAALPDVPNQGALLTQGSIVSQLTALVGSYTALDAATLAQTSARAQAAAQKQLATATLTHLKDVLTSFLGPTSPELVLFGLKPRGVRRPIGAVKMAAKVARASNTRTIRGTKGKAQKADLVSGPMAVTVAPVAPAAVPGAVVAPPGPAGK